MPDIEDDMKLQNWLSVLTFDVVKYVAAGGEVTVEYTDNGLVLRLVNVMPDTNGVHSKFNKLVLMAETEAVEAQP